MKFKSLLPALAFVSAIGMSFAPVKAEQQTREIEVNGVWEEVDVACNGSGNTCQVFYEDDPETIYDVYSADNHNTPLLSSSTEPMEISR